MPTIAPPARLYGARMHMTVEQYRQGFRDGTLAFCMPAAHAEISNEFLDEFSARVLQMDWRDISVAGDWHIPSIVTDRQSEEELALTIGEFYGVEVDDLPGLPFWDVVLRCARARSVPVC